MRTLKVLLLAFALLSASGCSGIFYTSTGQFSGTVSIVRLTATNDGTQVTFVTLINNSGSQDFNFCGNVVSQFPMNTTAQGSFQPGSACGTIIVVHISG